MNCFYASVEQMLDPTLRGKAIAVCGSQETRHGIVLAKSQLAKKAGVKTGMAIWQAKECCRDLIVVPPQYDQYLKYSRLAHEIYLRYTDRMEPYGMDECWLDLTGCRLDPVATAEEIRATTKSELGLTVSIGVSFNKIFAKLGSDMKKPDAMASIMKRIQGQTVTNDSERNIVIRYLAAPFAFGLDMALRVGVNNKTLVIAIGAIQASALQTDHFLFDPFYWQH